MEFSSETEAFLAGFTAARARLTNPRSISVPFEFGENLKNIATEVARLHGMKYYYGEQEGKAYVEFTSLPEAWLTEVPDPQSIEFNHWLAYVRGAFEANGCFTVSNKKTNGKTYSYRRIQFYYREGEERIANFVLDSWHGWLGDLGMQEGKSITVSFIPAGQGNRTKNTYSFTLSGKKEQVITNYMYHKASVTLVREDLLSNAS